MASNSGGSMIDKGKVTKIMAVGLLVCFFLASSALRIEAASGKCYMYGCNRTAISKRGYCSVHSCTICNGPREKDSLYCYPHLVEKRQSSNKKSTKKYNNKGQSNKPTNVNKGSSAKKGKKTSGKKKNYSNSYDEGYEDIWLNDDYDWDRYYCDYDYALGVDDAMDDEDW